jgi:hypothetical protein
MSFLQEARCGDDRWTRRPIGCTLHCSAATCCILRLEKGAETRDKYKPTELLLFYRLYCWLLNAPK